MKDRVTEDLKPVLLDYAFPQELSPNILKNFKIHCLKKMVQKPREVFFTLTGKTLYVPYIEVVLTTKCSLKCKNCSALMTFYDKPHDLDIYTLQESIERLVASVDSIYLMRLLGGEPLLYSDLYKVMELIAKQDKIKRVGVVTNGTLLIKDEKVLEILKNEKFYVYISNYGKISRHYQELIKQLKDNNIKYLTSGRDKRWIDYGDFTNRGRDESEVKKIYRNCTHKCRSLLEGKLYQCQRCSHGANLGLIPDRDEYIDLLDDKIIIMQLRKKMRKFVFGYTPYVECCKYCDMVENPKYVEPAIQKG